MNAITNTAIAVRSAGPAQGSAGAEGGGALPDIRDGAGGSDFSGLFRLAQAGRFPAGGREGDQEAKTAEAADAAEAAGALWEAGGELIFADMPVFFSGLHQTAGPPAEPAGETGIIIGEAAGLNPESAAQIPAGLNPEGRAAEENPAGGIFEEMIFRTSQGPGAPAGPEMLQRQPETGDSPGMPENPAAAAGGLNGRETPEAGMNLPGQKIRTEGLTSRQEAGMPAETGDAEGNRIAPFEKSLREEQLSEAEKSSLLTQEMQAAAAFGNAEPDGGAQALRETAPHGQIARAILSRPPGKETDTFTLKLNPEDLGEIQVKLRIRQGTLLIDIAAASAKTQAVLTAQADRLIAGLGLRNAQIETIQVQPQAPAEAGGQSGFQGNAFSMGHGFESGQRAGHESGFSPEGNRILPSGSAAAGEPETAEAKAVPEAGNIRFYRMNYQV